MVWTVTQDNVRDLFPLQWRHRVIHLVTPVSAERAGPFRWMTGQSPVPEEHSAGPRELGFPSFGCPVIETAQWNSQGKALCQGT